MFPNVNDNALIDAWLMIRNKSAEVFKMSLGQMHGVFFRDNNVSDFLLMLKVFPTHKSKFENAHQALITFSQVSQKIAVMIWGSEWIV